MRVSREEAAALAAEIRKKVVALQPRQDDRLLAQAVTATANLTGRPEWDVFLQRIQFFIDEETKALNGMAAALAIPNMTSEQILAGQRHMLAAQTRIDAWQQVLRLPKEILEAGGTAKEATAAS